MEHKDDSGRLIVSDVDTFRACLRGFLDQALHETVGIDQAVIEELTAALPKEREYPLWYAPVPPVIQLEKTKMNKTTDVDVIHTQDVIRQGVLYSRFEYKEAAAEVSIK